MNRYRFNGLDLPADGAPGNYGMFRVMRYAPQPEGKRVAGWVGEGKLLAGFGDAWVLAVEFAKPVKAYSILAYGQSRMQIHNAAATRLNSTPNINTKNSGSPKPSSKPTSNGHIGPERKIFLSGCHKTSSAFVFIIEIISVTVSTPLTHRNYAERRLSVQRQ